MKCEKWLQFVNRTEKEVKRLDATDILIINLAGMFFGSVASCIMPKITKKLAPFFAVFGMLSAMYVVLKLFFCEDDVPYIKIRR